MSISLLKSKRVTIVPRGTYVVYMSTTLKCLINAVFLILPLIMRITLRMRFTHLKSLKFYFIDLISHFFVKKTNNKYKNST